MMKYINYFSRTLLFLIISVILNGCLKDTIQHTYSYSWYEPLYKTKAEVISEIKSNTPKEVKNTGKIAIIGQYIFLNEMGKGIHVLDNSNPSSPKNIAFIDIPGNVDLAIKGNTLYADLYNDLVTLDIRDPRQVARTSIIENAFPDNMFNYGYADSDKIIYDWVRHDTTISIDQNQPPINYYSGGVFYDMNSNRAVIQNAGSAPNSTGISGSMSRFAIVENYLYTVGYSDLNVFNISTPSDPSLNDKVQIGNWTIETIFPFQDKLFIGSQAGMYIYNLNDPAHPAMDGKFEHVRSCDPVIADDTYAYVTLRSGSACQGFINQLDILQLNDFANPSLVSSYDLTNPHGLSKDGDILFICDGSDGLKIYNAADVKHLQLIKHFSNLESYDVIANNKIALVVAKDGIFQYDYSAPDNIHLLSRIKIEQ